MNSVLKGVLEEELNRNLQKQRVFFDEFIKYPKGSLVIVKVHDDEYVYRKHREGNKVVSKYVGPSGSDEAKKAYEQRNNYLKLKQDLKDLKIEEASLRKVIKFYD